MCKTMRHRGPDDEGYYLNGRLGLGQRRLSIIDLVSGQQPLSNENGTIWVTFNGEIYNFQELRDQLQQLGHRFVTHSDTEVIVHAYEQYGAECVKRFRGMFAFALWDEGEQSLLLARDRIGKKPLFYSEVANQFVFASELQALMAYPAIGREPEPTAIDDYLTYGYIPAPKTAFKGVYKLEPGHYLIVKMTASGSGFEKCGPKPYWQLEYMPKLNISEAEAAAELLQMLQEAVKLRLIADVPVGALLSGGTDSGIVVALMSQLCDQPVKTFSIGFVERDFNELPHARRVAQMYGTDHHEFIVRPQALEVLPHLVRHYGEPFADSSASPTYYVAKLTRQHVKVALNGDGGDECFAGYERYLGGILADRYQLLPGSVRRRVIEPLVSLIPESLPQQNRLRQTKHLLQVAGQPFAHRYLQWITYFRPEQKRELYTPEFWNQLAGYEGQMWLLHQLITCHDGLDRLDAMLATDVQSYLPYDLLVKMDIATMANSLEARSPFLDHKVMEFCAKLPCSYKLRGTTLKYLLKKVGKDLLPPENMARRKMGFGVPVGKWMRSELRLMIEEMLLTSTACVRNYFQSEPLCQLVYSHLNGEQDNSYRLWALLCLELWHQEFIS
jgi:asparagine synthase (glutamine-hydrolysing)